VEAVLHRAIIVYVGGIALKVNTLAGWFVGDKKAVHCYNLTGGVLITR